MMTGEEYVEAVLALVERIPPGRVMSYGAIADALAEVAGQASPRRVGTIMARHGGGVPWHRVVAADGRLPPGNERRARRLLAADGTPMRGEKVDMRAAAWSAPDRAGAASTGARDLSHADFTLRTATAADEGFLTDMLVAAANWRPGRERSRDDLLADPAIAHYLAGWPRPDDLGVVALDPAGHQVGAAWLRFFAADEPGYGYVSPDVPELGLAVVEDWRGRGVGRALLRRVADLARRREVGRISLSVERSNPAARLYASEGYRVVESGPASDTMVKQLSGTAGA